MVEKTKVLIIDDKPNNLEMTKDILEFAGYEALTANNAKNGIEMMRKSHPDLVLLDILMPEMDGYEAVRVIRSDDKIKQIPILAYTALATGINRDKALEYGCVDVITKPIDIDNFYKVIKTYTKAK